jgi:hypothetical protein
MDIPGSLGVRPNDVKLFEPLVEAETAHSQDLNMSFHENTCRAAWARQLRLLDLILLEPAQVQKQSRLAGDWAAQLGTGTDGPRSLSQYEHPLRGILV